jgi:hypothetical protein
MCLALFGSCAKFLPKTIATKDFSIEPEVIQPRCEVDFDDLSKTKAAGSLPNIAKKILHWEKNLLAVL